MARSRRFHTGVPFLSLVGLALILVATVWPAAAMVPGGSIVVDIYLATTRTVDETVTVQRVHQAVTVPAGKFVEAIQVQETTRLGDPPEVKWYAPGVGVIKGQTRNESFALIASTLRQ